MHYSKLSLIAALALSSVGSTVLSAQSTPLPEFEYLLTESTVTISYTLTTGKRNATVDVNTPNNGSKSVTTVADTMSVPAIAVLKSLQLQGAIDATPVITTSPVNAAGWQIVAVRPPASDVAFVDSRYDFYAINLAANKRQHIDPAVLSITPKYSTYNYVEQSIGAYTLSAKGNTTNFVELNHSLQFVRPGTSTTYQIDSLLSWGNASLTFSTVDEPILYFPISIMRFTNVGEFSGTTSAPSNIRGLATIVFQISAPKLVYASLYPNTPVGNTEINNPF